MARVGKGRPGLPGGGIPENLPCLRRPSGKGAACQKRRVSGRGKIREHYRKDEPYFRLPPVLSGEWQKSPDLPGVRPAHTARRVSYRADVREARQGAQACACAGMHGLPDRAETPLRSCLETHLQFGIWAHFLRPCRKKPGFPGFRCRSILCAGAQRTLSRPSNRPAALAGLIPKTRSLTSRESLWGGC
jgi:hypothetical protein